MSRKGKFYVGNISLTDYCLAHGISYQSVYFKIKRYNLTAEEAVKDIDDGEANPHYFNCKRVGKKDYIRHYIDGIPLGEWCKQHNLDYATVFQRYKRQYSVEELITGRTRTVFKKVKDYVIYNENNMPLIKAVFVATDGKGNTCSVRYRVKHYGMSLQQAFDDYVLYIKRKWNEV